MLRATQIIRLQLNAPLKRNAFVVFIMLLNILTFLMYALQPHIYGNNGHMLQRSLYKFVVANVGTYKIYLHFLSR